MDSLCFMPARYSKVPCFGFAVFARLSRPVRAFMDSFRVVCRLFLVCVMPLEFIMLQRFHIAARYSKVPCFGFAVFARLSRPVRVFMDSFRVVCRLFLVCYASWIHYASTVSYCQPRYLKVPCFGFAVFARLSRPVRAFMDSFRVLCRLCLVCYASWIHYASTVSYCQLGI